MFPPRALSCQPTALLVSAVLFYLTASFQRRSLLLLLLLIWGAN